jgi:NAD(P)H-hydrate repair Nnr-like enzyme with NAD(P)H-hydrate dehydratase domain
VAPTPGFSPNKGADTYVPAPGEPVYLNDHGHPGLGTAGSGDVLAGLLTGLCARGAEPLQAALWAVWLHASAGCALARRIGPVGFLAREIADEIPRELRRF